MSNTASIIRIFLKQFGCSSRGKLKDLVVVLMGNISTSSTSLNSYHKFGHSVLSFGKSKLEREIKETISFQKKTKNQDHFGLKLPFKDNFIMKLKLFSEEHNWQRKLANSYSNETIDEYYQLYLNVSFISSFLSLRTDIEVRLPRVPKIATRGIRNPSTMKDRSTLLLERMVVELFMINTVFSNKRSNYTPTFHFIFCYLSEI